MAANATAVWRVRPSGNNNNGGGYDAGIASAGTDFSQQNAAQVTQSGGTISTATTTLTDTGASFTSALIGNGIRVAGTGITTTYTFITAVPTGTTLTLQTSPGTTGTSVTYSIGGGWADPFTNTAPGPLVAGNTVNILGSTSPNPSSYVYDYTLNAAWTPAVGDASTGGSVKYANDPGTPGYIAPPSTLGGMPTIGLGASSRINVSNGGQQAFQGLWFALTVANSNFGIFNANDSTHLITYLGVVFDQAGFDSGWQFNGSYGAFSYFFGCELFSSQTAGAGGQPIFTSSASYLDSCNIHDAIGPGVNLNSGNQGIINSVVAKCNGYGVKILSGSSGQTIRVGQCTIDGHTGHGIEVSDQLTLSVADIHNNIISNNTGGGKFGLIIDAGTTAQNDRVKAFVDYNVYYNNTANYSAISAGAHDTAAGSDPYVGQSTENYTLA